MKKGLMINLRNKLYNGMQVIHLQIGKLLNHRYVSVFLMYNVIFFSSIRYP